MNKAKYEGLAPELRAVLDANSGAAAARMAAVPWDDAARWSRPRCASAATRSP